MTEGEGREGRSARRKKRSYGEFLNKLMNRKNTLLVMGAPLVDTLIHVKEDFLERIGGLKGGSEPINYGQLRKIESLFSSPKKHVLGGSALNVACAVSRLGHRAAFIGKVGIDELALLCRDQMRKERLIPYLRFSEHPTGRVLCFVTPDGQRTMRAHLGASAQLYAAELNDQEFSYASIFHTEGYSIANEELVVKAMGKAKGAGAKVSMDLSSFEWVRLHRSRMEELIDTYVDYLFCNRDEAYELLGIHDPKLACIALMKKVTFAVVTMGAEGAWIACDGYIHYCPANQGVHLKDSTGAGDMFTAGILHGILGNLSLEEIFSCASRLAAEVVQIDGAHLSDQTWRKLRKERIY